MDRLAFNAAATINEMRRPYKMPEYRSRPTPSVPNQALKPAMVSSPGLSRESIRSTLLRS